MTAKEERVWPRRAPPDASAGFNMFTGQRTTPINSEGIYFGASSNPVQEDVSAPLSRQEEWVQAGSAPPTASPGINVIGNHHSSAGSSDSVSLGTPITGALQEVIVPLDGKAERMWASRPLPDATAGFKVYSSHRNSLGSNEGTSFGAPIMQDGVTVPMDGLSMTRHMPGRRPPLDTLLIPRSQGSPGSSQANSFVFEGSVPLSARRGSPLKTPTSSQASPASSFTPSPVGSPSLVGRRRASAPNPSQSSPLAWRGSLQPRVPNSPNTGPWHGRSFADLTPRTPSPSDQRLNESSGVYAFGSPSHQAPMRSVGFPGGASVDPTTMRSSPLGHQSIGTDAGPLLSSIPPTPNRRHTFPSEMAGAQDMMREAMNRPNSLPVSPAIQRSPSGGFGNVTGTETPQGNYGRSEASHGRGGGNYVETTGSLDTASRGNAGFGVLEDAIKAQHFERVVALLEQGFSPNGERGSSKSPPLLHAVTTGNERIVKLLLNAGANINGCDSRQNTALHYAAASGQRAIVKILLVAGANLYAKTDGDLLPIQLTADQAIYEYLSARMKSDMEDRMSPRQAKPPSPRPPVIHPSYQRTARNDRDQWPDDAWVANSRSTGFTETGEPDKTMQTLRAMNASGVNINVGEGGSYRDREMLGSGPNFGEGLSSNIVMQPGYGVIDRQNHQGFGRQGAGANVMDWETYRDSPPEPIYQGYDQRAFVTTQSPNTYTDERVGFEQSQVVDVWMQEGPNNSRAVFTRPLPGQVLQERPPLQRAPSAPAVMRQEMEAIQQDLLRQNGGLQAQQNSPKVAPLQRAPSAPAELRQEMEEIQKDWMQKTKSTQGISFEEAEVLAVYKPEKQGSGLLDRSVKETEDSRIADVTEELECDGDDPHKLSVPMRKRFSRACDSIAPSMMEKFRAASSSTGHPLEVQKCAENSIDKASETPQAPETPRQEAETQEKPDTSELDRSGEGSSSSEKGKSGYVDARPTSALKGEVKKQKERKKSVTFALSEPSEEDLALIREDWHEAARSGCVGCGKAGCEGQCLSPDKTPPVPCNEAASCSSSSGSGSSSSKAVPEQPFSNAQPARTGSFRWTRGELLGEGAYGKVFAGLNQETGELMAVKQLKLDTPAEGQERQFYLAALEREISLYKTMRHKHIVGYIDMEQDNASGSLYVFLEYVSGGSIQSMLERFGRFSEPLVRVYTRQLLLGLEYLHGKKIVHRDIKGGNVLVDADGVVKLADFGASKAFHDPTQTDGFKSIRGSVFWMAPEVIKGDGYGRRADIWSVGCTVVEMLTAVHPWPGMDNTWTAIFHIAKASSGPPIPEGVSDIVKDFLSYCFQLDPKKRPTATELLQHPFVAETPPHT